MSQLPPLESTLSADGKTAYRWATGSAYTSVAARHARSLAVELGAMYAALAISHQLLAHYAHLLNIHDAGQRDVRDDLAAWIARCQQTPIPTP